MCYSGTCDFENHMGNCTVPCTREFEDKLGVTPCLVGGYAGIPKNEQLSSEEQRKFCQKAKELNLI